MVFHYDILSINRYEINSYGRDLSLDILTCAKKVSVVMLAPEQDTLLNQMLSSESKDGSLSSYHNELKSNYQSRDWLRKTSLDWINFLKKRLSNSDCYFYEYSGVADQLRLTPGVDSFERLSKSVIRSRSILAIYFSPIRMTSLREFTILRCG